jgi:hypothetical protein
MTAPALTRRGALALLGTVAGCSAVPDQSSGPVELDGAALRALGDDGPPSIPEALPVAPGGAHLAATERRARALVDAVPADLGPAAVPNGAIRERLVRAREHAVETLDGAAATAAPYERLTAFGTARPTARFAAGTWRAIDAGRRREDLADALAAVRRDRRAFAERRAYVGGDPVDATLVHAAVERRLDAARSADRLGDPRRYRPDNPLAVGEAAEDVERARVAVDDAAHLHDRLVASVDDPTTLRDRLVAAHGALRDEFESARASLPPIDPERPWDVEGVDVGETPAVGALEDLHDPIHPRGSDAWAETTPALALVWAHRAFVALGGFRSLRARVADGETFAVDGAADVAAMRAAAVEAIRAAERDPGVPALTRGVLAEATDRVAAVDRGLARVDDRVPVTAIRYECAEYLVARARANAATAASGRVAAALRD